jgi:hypothetical protein
VHTPLLRPWHFKLDHFKRHHHILSYLLVRIFYTNRLLFLLTRPRACSFILIFIEVPLLLRICPTSSKFDALIRRVTTNYIRAGVYLAMALVQWLSLILHPTSLIAAAVMLTIASLFYALAGFKGQDFVGSKTLGGQGVAQMII